MPDPLSPATSGLPLITNNPLVGRDNTAPVSSDAPVVPAHPSDGEKISLSHAARPQASAPGNTETSARGIIEAGLKGLEKAEGALASIQSLWQQEEPTAERIQPYAMQVIEAASTQYRGTSPLDSESAMSVGEQKIPAVKLVGENTNSLIEFIALMATPEAPAHLEVARDNVRWATEQFQQALQQLDQQQLGQIDGQLAARNVTSRPEVPQNLSASVHAAIDPRRVASLLA